MTNSGVLIRRVLPSGADRDATSVPIILLAPTVLDHRDVLLMTDLIGQYPCQDIRSAPGG